MTNADQCELFAQVSPSPGAPLFAGILPPGLTLVPRFISHSEEAHLLQHLDDPTQSFWLSDLKRRVQHFGYRYDYKKRALTDDDRIGPFPDWAQDIAERLVAADVFPEIPEQLIVNEYEPGQGIASHTDRTSCFGPTVASLSLGSSVVMDFSRDDLHGAALLPECSLLVLSGEARSDWEHAISSRRTDSINGHTLKRSRRVSLTFRSVIHTPTRSA